MHPRTIFPVALLVVAALLAAPSASAKTVVVSEAPTFFPYQEWIDASLLPTPDVTISATESGECGYCPLEVSASTGGQTTASGSITVDPAFVMTWGDRPYGEFRFALMELVGGLFERIYMTDADRERFSRITRNPKSWDRDCCSSPKEHFRTAYALCSLRRTIPYYHSEIKEWGDEEASLYHKRSQHRRVCRLIRQSYWN